MKKILLPMLLAICLLNSVKAQESSQIGTTFLNYIKVRDWNNAESLFSFDVRGKVSALTLKKIFDNLNNQLGQLESFSSLRSLSTSNRLLYIGHFSNSSLPIEINVNDSSKITGFFFVPVSKFYKTPQYADPTAFKQ
jgi:hypothetical protein